MLAEERPRLPVSQERREPPTPPHPNDMPDLYACTCVGDCLEPVFSDGATLVFDKLSPVRVGDFVVLHFKPDRVKSGLPSLVKRLAMALPPELGRDPLPGDEVEFLVVVETLKPPRRFSCRAADIVAVHRCIGPAELRGGKAELPRAAINAARAARKS